MLMTTAVLGSIIAVGMLWRGLRPRRVGDTPFCKPCGYNLTGLTSERCPECGHLVATDGVVYGMRHRRPRMIVTGAITLALCTGLLVNHWLNLDWTRYKPTFWLMSDVQTSKLVVAQRTIRELDRRFKAGKLSPKWQSRLIDFCLKQQAADPPIGIRDDLLRYLGAVYSAGRLSEAQTNLMFAQSVKCELRVRPRLVAGEELPLTLTCRMYGPILPSGRNLSLRIDSMAARLDNGLQINLGGSSSGMASPGSSLGDGRKLATKTWPTGKHILSVKARVSLYTGASSPNISPDHEQELMLTAPFELLSAEPPGGLVRGVRDDGIKENLKNLFRIERLEYKNRSLLGVISANVHQTLWPRGPVPVAFDLTARVDGREIPLNATMACLLKPNSSHSSHFQSNHKLDLPLVATCDIILRGSEMAARSTIDLYEYWDGELVFPNLPIAGLDVLSTPTGSSSSPETRPSSRPARQNSGF